MGAVGIHPMAVDNSWQYRPQESPANNHIIDDAGDAVGILRTLRQKIILLATARSVLTSTMALQSRLERRSSRCAGPRRPRAPGPMLRPLCQLIHIHVRTAEPRILDRPHELLTTPLLIESSSRVVERPEGSAEKIDNVLWKTCFGILLVTWVKGLALIYASLVKHPYRSVATYFMTNGSIRSADR